MNVVVCPKCFTEMGFEKLPIYVDCKKCKHRFLSDDTAQPKNFISPHDEQYNKRTPRVPQPPELRLLNIVRAFSFIMLGYMLILPAIIYDATGADAPAASIFALIGVLIFLFGLIGRASA